MSAHAKLGPSAGVRWMTCTASVADIERHIEKYGETPAGEAAELGTACHMAAEWCLRNNKSTYHCVGEVFNGHKITEEMTEWFDDYVEGILWLNHSDNRRLLKIEERVTVEGDLVWGTADAILILDKTLHIVDLKTGYNKVDAVDNVQLLLYALGAFQTYSLIYEIEDVVMTIYQPRIENHSVWQVSPNYLKKFRDRLDDALLEIESGPQYRPSPGACQWCPVRGRCAALDSLVRKEAQQDFAAMDQHHLAVAWERLPLIDVYVKGVKAAVMESLERGEDVPGLKLVEGRRSRQWMNQEEAEKYLSRRIPKFKATAYEHKFRSPAQIEGILKKVETFKPTDIEPLIEFRAGPPTIVKAEDKRPGISPGDRAAADFSAVEDL